MARRVYGISGITPPNAIQRAILFPLLSAVSITSTFTKPSCREPQKLIIPATRKASNASTHQKLFKKTTQTN